MKIGVVMGNLCRSSVGLIQALLLVLFSTCILLNSNVAQGDAPDSLPSQIKVQIDGLQYYVPQGDEPAVYTYPHENLSGALNSLKSSISSLSDAQILKLQSLLTSDNYYVLVALTKTRSKLAKQLLEFLLEIFPQLHARYQDPKANRPFGIADYAATQVRYADRDFAAKLGLGAVLDEALVTLRETDFTEILPFDLALDGLKVPKFLATATIDGKILNCNLDQRTREHIFRVSLSQVPTVVTINSRTGDFKAQTTDTQMERIDSHFFTELHRYLSDKNGQEGPFSFSVKSVTLVPYSKLGLENASFQPGETLSKDQRATLISYRRHIVTAAKTRLADRLDWKGTVLNRQTLGPSKYRPNDCAANVSYFVHSKGKEAAWQETHPFIDN